MSQENSSTELEPELRVPRSVERVLDLVETVVFDRSCTLSVAASATSLTPTTTLRYLRALETRGYLERDNLGAYSPGATLVRLAVALHRRDPLERLVGIAQPRLNELAAATQESSYLAVGDKTVATYIAISESPRAIRHVGRVGQNVSLKHSAVGAALAEPHRVMCRVAAVEPDITAVSIGIGHFDGLELALSVVGPSPRFDSTTQQAVQRSLESTAEKLCGDLGLSMTVRVKP